MVIIEDTPLPAGQAAVACEQQRLRAEVAAFQEFAERLSDIEPQRSQRQISTSGTFASLSTNRPTSADQPTAFNTVHTAYRETVLDVDHWQTAYAEATVEESLVNEFSSDLADALTNTSGTTFSPMLRNRLIAEATQAATTRSEVLAVLDTEAAQLDTLTDDLEQIVEQLRSVEHDDDSFAQRVQGLERACQSLEELAQTHQEYLHKQQTDSNSVFTELVYAELETVYPGLSALDDEYIAMIAAHELGHVDENHAVVSLIGTVVLTALSLLYFRYFVRHHWMLFLIVGSAVLVGRVVFAWARRQLEYRADRYAAKLLEDPHQVANGLRALRDIRMTEMADEQSPGRLYERAIRRIRHCWTRILSTHPPIDDRITHIERLEPER